CHLSRTGSSQGFATMSMPSREPRTAPYGAWESPIDAALVASAGIAFARTWALPGGGAAWLEGRPAEAGRVALVRRDAQRGMTEVTPPDANVRTRVHEYGGGACWLFGDTVFYTHFPDQRLYRLDPGREPHAITPEPAE